MSYLVLDVESTIKNDGHPFTPSNKLCLIGYKDPDRSRILKVEYDDDPYGAALAEVQEQINEGAVLVGFNLKFDLHWLRRYGIVWPDAFRVHDCQLAFFIETFQQHKYPSLNEAAEYYGLPPKLDVVENEYWSKGIDTPQVPYDILARYLQQDLDITEQMYLKQVEFLEEHPRLRRLFRLQCQDLLVLEEMEWNGLPFDVEESNRRAEAIEDRRKPIIDELHQIVGLDCVNWDSPDQVSSALYGGTIEEKVKEKFLFHYKDPKREPVWKERWMTITHTLPRLVTPLPNTSLQKEGKWSTGAEVLGELSGSCNGPAARCIQLLLSLAELTKLKEAYVGIPKLIREMEWENNVVHHNLNQCNVVTGRLSSSKPNGQNMTEEVHECVLSRF